MSRVDESRSAGARTPTDVSTAVDQVTGAGESGLAPTMSPARTPIRVALVGEHCARIVDWLTSVAHSDSTDDLVLNMSIANARILVAALDACCDRMDANNDARHQKCSPQPDITQARSSTRHGPTGDAPGDVPEPFVAYRHHEALLGGPIAQPERTGDQPA